LKPATPWLHSKILEQNKLTPPVTTNFARAEKLSEVYPANTFDFIWCNNALDHSFDPVYAISEMIHVAKIGGTVVLSHNENEAVNENYDGFHQWNFTERNNEFIIWNKDFDINVTKLLEPGTKVVIERKGDTKTWIMVRITKTEGKVDQAIFPKQIINHGLINYCTKLILDTKPVLF
jgi:SAM-dependent methyltransferase